MELKNILTLTNDGVQVKDIQQLRNALTVWCTKRFLQKMQKKQGC